MTLAILASVRERIESLSNPQYTKESNEWLMAFERSPEAWSVSEGLLSESNPTLRFFGAKFLYSKIQKQSIVLSNDQKSSLRSCLVQHVLRIGSIHREDVQTLRYLCLCLSALSLQCNDAAVVTSTLADLNPLIGTNAAALVVFLTVLPEEVHNSQIDISPSARSSFLVQLNNNTNDVLQFLSAVWSIANIADSERCRLLSCLTKWVENTDIPWSALIHHMLTKDALNALSTGEDDVLDHCVELVLAIVHRYKRSNMDSMIGVLFPLAISLRDRWEILEARYPTVDKECVDDSFLSQAFSLSKLFAEIAEQCIDLFVDLRRDIGQIMFVRVLLKACAFPFDANVSRTSQKFFYDLALLIKTGDFGADVQSVYDPIFKELLVIALQQLMVLAPQSIQIANSDDINDWREVILDCMDVVGADVCFHFACDKLQAFLGSGPNWQGVFAALTALSATVEHISEDSANMVVPDLIKFCCSVTDAVPSVLIATQTLLGKMSIWYQQPMVRSAQPAVFQYLLSQLSVAAISMGASQSIAAICKRGSPPLEVVRAIVDAIASCTLQHDVELNLIESAACCLPSLDAAQQGELVDIVVMGVTSSVQNLLVSSQHDWKLIGSRFDRVNILCKWSTSSPVLCRIFNSTWSMFTQVISLQPKEFIVEKICKCWKFIIRTCKTDLGDCIPAVLDTLVAGFAQFGFSAFLYCFSVCVSTFGQQDSGKYQGMLYRDIWRISDLLFSDWAKRQPLDSIPDVAEEYFYLIAKAVQYCPVTFLNSFAQSQVLIQYAVTGLAIHHREAQKGMLWFLQLVCQLPTSSNLMGDDLQTAKLLVDSISMPVIEATFRLLGAVSIAYALDESNGCIGELLWELRRSAEREKFENHTVSAVSTLPLYAQEIANKLDIVKALTTTTSRREFIQYLDRYEVACRRNMF